jgi:DHA1 family bicyclomycin/chloramphenicol resistance-like MFS transporter
LSALTAVGPFSIDMYLPGLPSIAATLQVSEAGTQLTLSAFFLGFGIGQLIYGPLSDRFGRRRPLLAGFLLFVLASVGCALARDLDTLIALRFVQALGGCAGPVIARAIVRDLFERERAARALSLMMLIMGIAPVLAPLIGGQILLLAGWRAIFGLIAAFGAIAIIAILVLLGETLPFARRMHGSALTLVLGFGAPLMSRRFLGYALSGAFIYGGMFTYITGSPHVFITLYGVLPERFGLIFGGNVLGILAAAAINSRIVMRYGVDRLLALGVISAAIFGCALAIVAALNAGGLVGFLIPLFFFIASLGFVGSNAMAGCLSLFPTRAGIASALAGTMLMVVGTLLSALLGLLGGDSALPMAGIIAASALASLATLRTLLR